MTMLFSFYSFSLCWTEISLVRHIPRTHTAQTSVHFTALCWLFRHNEHTQKNLLQLNWNKVSVYLLYIIIVEIKRHQLWSFNYSIKYLISPSLGSNVMHLGMQTICCRSNTGTECGKKDLSDVEWMKLGRAGLTTSDLLFTNILIYWDFQNTSLDFTENGLKKVSEVIWERPDWYELIESQQ